MVMPWKTKSSPPGMRRVEWFGDGMFSEVRSTARGLLYLEKLTTCADWDFSIAFFQIYTDNLMPFGVFSKCFCKNSFASLPTYKEAIFQIIEVRDQNVPNILCSFPDTVFQSPKNLSENVINQFQEMFVVSSWQVKGVQSLLLQQEEIEKKS